MPDRVIFGTSNDTVTPANSSGFNGFPFPHTYLAPGGGTGSGTSYPAIVPLDKAIEWIWRVRTWEVATDILGTFGGPTSGVFNGNLIADPFAPANELDLIAPVARTYKDAAGGATTFTFSLNYPMYRNGADLHPLLDITGIDLDAFGMIFSTSFVFGAPDLIVPADVDGIALDVGVYKNGIATAVSGTFLDLTPVEWWAYAARDGSPIYNTATGAQLQDPRN